MWKGIAGGLIVGLAGLVGYLLHLAHAGGLRVVPAAPPLSLTYADFVAILLTGFGVIIAIASIALAVAGVVGWNSIEGKAMRVAERVTRSNINDKNGTLHRLIQEAISNPASPLHITLKDEAQRVMFAGIQAVDVDQDEPSEEDELKAGKDAN